MVDDREGQRGEFCLLGVHHFDELEFSLLILDGQLRCKTHAFALVLRPGLDDADDDRCERADQGTDEGGYGRHEYIHRNRCHKNSRIASRNKHIQRSREIVRAVRTGIREGPELAGRAVMLSVNILLVPLVDLTDAELATAAQACRAMTHQEGERAKKLENPTIRGPIEAAAQRYRALVVKLEAARRRSQ